MEAPNGVGVEAVGPAPPAGGGLAALLVEDDPDLRRLLAAVLAERGHRVVACPDAEAAWAARAGEEFPLVVLDRLLPGMDGLALCRRLRALPGGDRPVVLVLTARARPEDLAAVLAAGADDCLAKPFDLGHLEVRLAVAERQARANLDRAAAEGARARLAAIVASSGDAIIGMRPDGTIESWNPGAERLYGYAAGEAVGRSVAMLVPPERADELPALLARVARGERVDQHETASVAKDGRRLDVALTISPIRDGQGRVVGAATVARDVTDRRRAETVLARRARDAALRVDVGAALAVPGELPVVLGRCAAAIVARLEAARATVWLLDEGEQMLELRAAAGEAAPPGGAEARVPVGRFRVGRVAQERRPLLSNDLAGSRQPGDRDWASRAGLVAFAGHPLLVEGRVVGVLAVFARQPLAEDTIEALASVADAIAQGIERKRAEGALAAERDLLQTVMDSAPDLIYVKDTASRFVRLNRAAARVLGVADPREAIGQTDAAFFPAALAAEYLADERSVLATERPLLDKLERQSEDDATARWVLTSKVPLRDGAGAVVGLVGTARDVTARHRLEQARAAALAAERAHAGRLEELATLRAGFVAMVAHELGSPLAAIRALAAMLATGEVPPAEAAAALASIRAEAEQLERLVADVTAAAAAERDDFAVRPRPVELGRLLADAAAFARALPGDHPVTTELAATGPVRADPERIGQVLRNLLANAAKHTPPATPIELRAVADGGRVRVEVADRGPGIHPDDLGRVFEKFGRGRDAAGRRVPGVGLGLYLSRRIVRAHGAELTVAAAPGRGTVFGFALERAR